MRQLQVSSEMFRSMDDRSLLVIWTEDSQIFRAEMPNTKLLPGTEDEILNEAVGEQVPNDHLFPPWSDALTEAKQPLSPDVYVKMRYTDLLLYDGTPMTERFIAGVRALERISKEPHPNVCKYFGCFRNGNAIGGICLGKYQCTLTDLVRGKIVAEQAPPFLPDVIIPGIKAGIDHIHSLGLVHGDINPHNIMLDKAGNPIIIDFDTCVAVGTRCPSQGTPGWSQIERNSQDKIAAFENDAYGFDLVAKFVRGEYDGQDYDLGFEDEDLDSGGQEDQQ